ncbi:ras and Rab interactor 3 [Coregonus clupeaformis]|uniref:ras and Rab interactor 3 n=1 Tax=Coregonus clupeaformis TaxID=59861 RepID=UPI001E1C8D70|nr:ras and Rab interactor 3 [Coregonus clupeaformis]XP_045079486.1 ras and Rab interactor 3 [Coregonus clupeaformis]
MTPPTLPSKPSSPPVSPPPPVSPADPTPSPSSSTTPLLSASEPLPPQIDLAIDVTDTTDVPHATVPEDCTPPLPKPLAPDVPKASTSPLPTPVPPQVSVPSTLPFPDILDASSVPELSSSEPTVPALSSHPVPKPSSMPLSAPISKPSLSPFSSPPVPPVSKLSSPPLSRPSAPRKLSGPSQPRPPVPHPHSIAKPSSPALPRPPLPSTKPSSPPLPTPLVPLAPKPSPAPASSPAPAPAPTPATAPPPSISILEKLIKTCPVWLQLAMAQEKSSLILKKETPGIFLVRKSPDQKAMVLSVRISNQQGEPQVQDVLVKEEKSLIYLEGSVLVFDNIFKLISFYCVSRDILPFTLRLPEVIVQATKYEDIEMISTLGSDFWVSQMNSSSEEPGQGSRPVGHGQGQGHSSSCEIQLSTGTGNDRLWYVNPIFIEEYCSSLEASTPVAAPILRSQSLNTPGSGQGQVPPKFKRPPPRPPNVPEGLLLSQGAKQGNRGTSDSPSPRSPPPPLRVTAKPGQKGEGNSSKGSGEGEKAASQLVSEREVSVTATDPVAATQPLQHLSPHGATAGHRHPAPRPPPHRIPLVPLRRMPSEKRPPPPGQEPPQPDGGTLTLTTPSKKKDEGSVGIVPVASLVCIDVTTNMADEEKELRVEPYAGEIETLQRQGTSETSNSSEAVTVAIPAPLTKRAAPPVPPPRKNKPSQATLTTPLAPDMIGGGLLSINASLDIPQTSSTPLPARMAISIPEGEVREARGADVSLYAPDGGAALPALDHDSYSTSSTEEEADTVASRAGGAVGTNNTKVSMKRTPTIMLDRAKQRLSMVNFSSVFTNFMSADHKLQKRIVELSRDGSSYFGNLVKDYRVYILETMVKHSSSTELLQEIRQMMTQLKSYLIQSTELQNLLEPNVYTEEKLEVIMEAALCKAVLKPLREAVYSGLKDIHARGGCLKRLRENQSVVLGTTTTDLGVTTSVPETTVMEKIQLKLMTLHLEYSPQKKIDLLLKTCKIIYESMSIGCPGRAHGVDDFLPVLMYVLARSNMAFLLLDVEYMMELMDPALQLGEGSYYLTTTYGALEHIKNYDKQAVTQQLSLEIQDSIHRWEKRRTLNKARLSCSSVQDFINVSFLEAGSNTKTLGVHPTTTAQDLCAQCADKFEVLEPESYSLSVLVEGHYQPLAPEEFPLTIKSSLHHSEPRKAFYFVYRPGRTESEGQEAESEETATAAEPEPDEENNLIEI